MARPKTTRTTPGLVIKRRMRLLKRLAAAAGCRHDVKTPLSEVAPTLDIKAYAGGSRFVDKTNPEYSGGSNLAYDFNSLREEGLIEMCHMTYRQGPSMGVHYEDPAVKLTLSGLEAVAEANKSWITKAIEKEPATFLQIIVAIIIALLSGLGGWVLGRYTAPSNATPMPQIQSPQNPPPVPGANHGN